MQPKRIQRRRLKGWKMPPNTLSVTRPGRYGNPFRVGDRSPGNHAVVMDAAHAVEHFRAMLESMREESPEQFEEFVAPLRGKNLACYCRLDQPCHGDVLLEIANR